MPKKVVTYYDVTIEDHFSNLDLLPEQSSFLVKQKSVSDFPRCKYRYVILSESKITSQITINCRICFLYFFNRRNAFNTFLGDDKKWFPLKKFQQFELY